MTITQDIRFGLRMLKTAPGFTAVALLSLALGIGVATSAFSELNGFVLRDVPAVSRPGELVLIEPPTSYPNYRNYRERSDLFKAALAYAAPVPLGVLVGGRTERTWGHLVSSSYFSTLGVRPALGRLFGPEDEAAGRTPIVVFSFRFWQNHLGSDRAIVGKSLRINGQPCTVIGIAQEEFQGASPMVYSADLWLPASVDPRVAPELAGDVIERHDSAMFHVVGRMQPGVTPERVEAELDAAARQMEQQYGDPDRNQKGRRVKALPGGKLMPIPQEGPAVPDRFLRGAGRCDSPDCELERGQHDAGPRGGPAARDRHPAGTGLRTLAPDAPVDDGEPDGRRGRRRARLSDGDLGDGLGLAGEDDLSHAAHVQPGARRAGPAVHPDPYRVHRAGFRSVAGAAGHPHGSDTRA